MELREGEFDLDGYRFGTAENDAIILAGGFDTGAPDIRVQDFANPVADGAFFGRDYMGGPAWTFEIGVLDDEDVYTRLAEIAAVWRNAAVRLKPGALSTLRFRRGGKTYRVYGRPRNFGVSPAEIADERWQIVTAQFQVAGPVMFADEEQTVEMDLLNSAQPGDGLVLPAVLPAELGRVSTGEQRTVNVASIEPVPFTIKVYGPVTGALSDVKISGPGFEFRVDAAIAYDEILTIDTFAQTIEKGGVSIPGALRRPSRLNARMDPGVANISFRGTDPSRTARMAISWRPTYPII